jgi:hypothetical protein
MQLNDLVQQRQELTCAILNCLQEQITSIKISAEEMVECATNIKGQGYSMFINARESFLDKIDSLQKQLENSAVINTCTHH